MGQADIQSFRRKEKEFIQMYLKKRLGMMAQTTGRVDKIQKILKRREDLNGIQNELFAQVQQAAIEHEEVLSLQMKDNAIKSALKNNQGNTYS